MESGGRIDARICILLSLTFFVYVSCLLLSFSFPSTLVPSFLLATSIWDSLLSIRRLEKKRTEKCTHERVYTSFASQRIEFEKLLQFFYVSCISPAMSCLHVPMCVYGCIGRKNMNLSGIYLMEWGEAFACHARVLSSLQFVSSFLVSSCCLCTYLWQNVTAP